MSPYLAEFIGTAFLVLLGDTVVCNVVLNKTKGNSSGWIVIAFGWAVAVLIPALMFGPTSGAHFNPALTLGLAINGALPMADLVPYIVCQMLGAIFGGILVWLMYKDHFDATDDQGAKLGCFCTVPAIRNPMSNLFSEILATFVLVFCILGVTQTGVGASPALGTFEVCAIILSCGVSLGGTTGYAINPARDLGPRIAHAIVPIKGKGSSDWGYAWIPVCGPFIGGVLGAVCAAALFV